jgi:hypothetical protein
MKIIVLNIKGNFTPYSTIIIEYIDSEHRSSLYKVGRWDYGVFM